MPEHDADEGQRDRRQDHERQLERAELRDDEDVDAEYRDHECPAHVAEGDPGHLPFAIPEQRRMRFVVRLAVQRDSGFRRAAPVGLVDGIADGNHAVDRRLECAGEFCGHHLDRASVMAEDRERGRLARHRHDVAEFDHRALAGDARSPAQA